MKHTTNMKKHKFNICANKQFHKVKQKKALEDYRFYIGTSMQASNFELSAEYIINYIKKIVRGNDISGSLRALQDQNVQEWRPKLTAEDAIEKERQNEQFKFDYKGELDRYIRRSTQHNDNLCKAYALLWVRCTKAMQHKIAS